MIIVIFIPLIIIVQVGKFMVLNKAMIIVIFIIITISHGRVHTVYLIMDD